MEIISITKEENEEKEKEITSVNTSLLHSHGLPNNISVQHSRPYKILWTPPRAGLGAGSERAT